MYPELDTGTCVRVADMSCQIIRRLAAGGSSVAYLARLDGGSYCVLKEFAPSWLRTGAYYTRNEKQQLILTSSNSFVINQYACEKETFNREVSALSKLNRELENNHPNAFGCLAHDQEQGRIILYTQNGMTFSQWHDKYAGMLSAGAKEREQYILACVDLASRLLCVLESMHQNNKLLHLDIKPENLFLSSDSEDASPQKIVSSGFSGSISILDFGSARKLSDFQHAAQKAERDEITLEELEKLFDHISYTPRFAHPALKAVQSECGTPFALLKDFYVKIMDERLDYFSAGCVLAYLLDEHHIFSGWKKLKHLFGCCDKLDRTLEVISRAIDAAVSPKRGFDAKDILHEMRLLLGQAERALNNEAGLYELYLQMQSGQKVCHVEENLLSHVLADEREEHHLASWYLQKKDSPVRAVVLSPEGGAGKTSQLYHLHQKLSADQSLVALYIPLRHLKKGEGFLDYAARIYGKINDREVLVNLICSKRCSWVFLLDGVNEAGRNQDRIFEDIEELKQEKHVHFILSSRDAVRRSETMDFEVVSLLPLDREFVLRETDGRCTERMLDILLNPMMLTIYRHIRQNQDFAVYQQVVSPGYQVNTAAELMHMYLETQIFKYAEDEKSRWRRRFRMLASLAARYSYSESIGDEWLTDDEMEAIECGVAAGVVTACDNENAWMFAHESWQAFFCGKYLEGMVKNLLKAPQHERQNALAQWNNRLYTEESLRYAGELLKEYNWIPQKDEKSGLITVPAEHSPIQKILNMLQNRKGFSTAIANLVDIMRLGRRNDLSAADLSHLDLTETMMHHVCFSREDGMHQADFTGAAVDLSCFILRDEIYAVHPWNHFWVCIDQEGISCRLPGNHRKISQIPICCNHYGTAVRDCDDYAMVYALDNNRKNYFHAFKLDSEGMLTHAYSHEIELCIQLEKGESVRFIFDKEAKIYRIKESNGCFETLDEKYHITYITTFYATRLRCFQNRVYAINNYHENIGVDIESGQILGDPSFEDGYGRQMIFHPLGNVTLPVPDEAFMSPCDLVLSLDEEAKRMAYFSSWSETEKECDLEIWSIQSGKPQERMLRCELPVAGVYGAAWYGDMLIAFCGGYCCMLNLQGKIIWKIGTEKYEWTHQLNEAAAKKIHDHMNGQQMFMSMVREYITDEAYIKEIMAFAEKDLNMKIHDPVRAFEFSLSTDEPDQFRVFKCYAKRDNLPDCQLTLEEMDEVFRDDPKNKPVFLKIKGCSMRGIRILNDSPKERRDILRVLAYCGAVVD